MESKYIKYPKTWHLPHSNLLKDDRLMPNDDMFIGKEIVMTLKMDGENTSMYNDHIHARSLDSNNHASRNWVKGLWGQIRYMIPEDMRICGENMYALHTVPYTDLPSYFLAFSVWADTVCLDWDKTVEFVKSLGLETVPVVYEGIYDAKKIQEIFMKYEGTNEGYVIRLRDQFTLAEFHTSIGKFVRPEFRQAINDSDVHWASKKIEPNKLKGA
jgi:hypothetical protein